MLPTQVDTKKYFGFTPDYSITLQQEWGELSPTFDTYYRMYNMNADLYRCIEEICQTSMSCGYEYYKETTEGEKKYESKDIDAVLTNQGDTTVEELKNDMLRSYLLTGNIFLLKRYNAMGLMGFRVLDPRNVKVTYNEESGKALAYKYKLGNEWIAVWAEIIHHFRNGMDMNRKPLGTSALRTIIADVMGDYQASLANYSYFKNDILPSHVAVMEDGFDPKDIPETLKKMRDDLSGGTGKHKVMVMNGIREIVPIEKRHVDMEFIEQKKYTTEKVCSAMGVPKIILGYTDGVNYSSSETQYAKFIENTIRPIERLIESWFNTMIKDIEEGVYFCVEDEHQNDFEEGMNTYIEAVKGGILTQNEARQKLWLDPLPNPAYDLLVTDLQNNNTPQ